MVLYGEQAMQRCLIEKVLHTQQMCTFVRNHHHHCIVARFIWINRFRMAKHFDVMKMILNDYINEFVLLIFGNKPVRIV